MTYNRVTDPAAAPVAEANPSAVDAYLNYIAEVGDYRDRSDEEDVEAYRLRDIALASGDPHPYSRSIDGGQGGYEIVRAESMPEAIDDAVDWAWDGCWDTEAGTIWVEVEDLLSERRGYYDISENRKIQIDPEEPDCIESEGHDWQSPMDLVGGCKEAPGVYGHGGGVTVTEVCVRCGCGRHTDTWAQDPSDGEQGLESVRYVPGEWGDAIERMREDAG